MDQSSRVKTLESGTSNEADDAPTKPAASHVTRILGGRKRNSTFCPTDLLRARSTLITTHAHKHPHIIIVVNCYSMAHPTRSFSGTSWGKLPETARLVAQKLQEIHKKAGKGDLR